MSYWPRRFSREETVQAFAEIFESFGYRTCTDGKLEANNEKIALYCSPNGTPTHAAKQIAEGLHPGQWKSKIGRLADIRHATLEALEGDAYGKVHSFFARKIKS